MNINIGDRVLTTQGDIGIIIGKDNRLSFDKNNRITNRWIVELTLNENKVRVPFFEYELVAILQKASKIFNMKMCELKDGDCFYVPYGDWYGHVFEKDGVLYSHVNYTEMDFISRNSDTEVEICKPRRYNVN